MNYYISEKEQKAQQQQYLINKVLSTTNSLNWFYNNDDNTKDRCNALEALHKIDLNVINQKEVVILIKACNNAIESYDVCSGYIKHWKYFRTELTNRLKPDTFISLCQQFLN